MFVLNNILVATDFSECSAAALNYGRALARQFGARLHVLHVVEMAVTGGFGIDGYVGPMVDMQSTIEESEKAQLEALITADDRAALGAKTIIRSFETPARAIDEYARAERIDLIVIGTHGRRGLSHLVMGSVAEKVVRSAFCPVLTVRTPEHEFVLPDVKAVSAAAHQ
jgi:nucleotide-binding universal stress UspA family protein